MVQKGRILVREGTLIEIDPETRTAAKTYLFLFNDLVVTSRQMSQRKKLVDHTVVFDFKTSIPLRVCVVEDVVIPSEPQSPATKKKNSGANEATLDNLCFKIRDLRPKGSSFILKTTSIPEKTKWVNDFKEAIRAITLKEPDDSRYYDNFSVEEPIPEDAEVDLP